MGAYAQVRAPLQLVSPVQDKNFYLLSLMERTAEVRRAIAMDGALRTIEKTSRGCDLDPSCYAVALKWTDAEIEMVATELRSLYAKNTSVKHMVDGPLRDSGVLVRYNQETGGDVLARGWSDAARGINHAIEVYGLGQAPRYADIDSIAFDAMSDSFHRLVKVIALSMDRQSLFFEPSLRFALALMDASHRDEAGRLEPLESGENAAALHHLTTVQWGRFPYSVIVVPGSGTDRLSWSLSPYGKIQLQLAARRFREGKAPFILVSGGYVHPNQTPYCEALEMKKSLITDFGIPANAILVEPHARHTTTNLRNAVRELYRYKFPFDKKALVTTDPLHSQSIKDASFAKRCITELGYEPVRVLGRVSIFDLEFLPRVESLQMDATDPLDP